MHIISSDLNFKWLTSLADQSRMKRLIHIRLGHSDVIFKSTWNRLIELMNYTKSRVTILDCSNNDSDSKQIIYLVKSLILVTHFLINTKEMLNSSVYFAFYTSSLDSTANILANVLDVFFSFTFSDGNLIYKIVVDIRLEIFQRKVIKFNLNPADT